MKNMVIDDRLLVLGSLFIALVPLSLPKKSVVRITDRPDVTMNVYCGCKSTTI